MHPVTYGGSLRVPKGLIQPLDAYRYPFTSPLQRIHFLEDEILHLEIHLVLGEQIGDSAGDC